MESNFRNSLIVEGNKKSEQIKRELDAYKDFVSTYLMGYIKFMEAINIIITELERKEVIGRTKLKSRIKAVESSLINSQKKG